MLCGYNGKCCRVADKETDVSKTSIHTIFLTDFAQFLPTTQLSYFVAAFTSAVAFTNLAFVQFNGPKPAPPATVSQTVTATPKQVAAPEPSETIRKAPLALRTGPAPKVSQEESIYNSLFSRMTAPKVEKEAPKVEKEVKKQESTETPKAASYYDSMIKKIEEKKEIQRIELQKLAEQKAAQAEKKAEELQKLAETKAAEAEMKAKEAPKVLQKRPETKADLAKMQAEEIPKVAAAPEKAEENIEEPAKVEPPKLEAKIADEPKPEVKVEAPKPEEKMVEEPKLEVKPKAPIVEAKKTEEPKPEVKAKPDKG